MAMASNSAHRVLRFAAMIPAEDSRELEVWIWKAQGKAHHEDELQLVEGPEDEEDHEETWESSGRTGLERRWLTYNRTANALKQKASPADCLNLSLMQWKPAP